MIAILQQNSKRRMTHHRQHKCSFNGVVFTNDTITQSISRSMILLSRMSQVLTNFRPSELHKTNLLRKRLFKIFTWHLSK